MFKARNAKPPRMLRPWVLWTLASAMAAGPIVAYETNAVPDIDSVQEQAGSTWEKGYHQLFSPAANLTVVGVESHPTRVGAFNETIRADPGFTFRYVRVRIVNTGNVDLGVHAYQFSAVDDAGSDTPAALGNLHEDMEALRVRAHGAVEGVVIFEMRESAALHGVVWTGDFASAEANLTASGRTSPGAAAPPGAPS